MNSHSRLSPSSAHRWINCTGSIKLEELYPNNTSEFAAEGIKAHELAALMLTTDIQLNDFSQDEEMNSHVNGYVDYVRKLSKNRNLFVEKRVDFSNYVCQKDSFGTSDALIIGKSTAWVVDLKYGKGVKVYSSNNYQLMLYALGALFEFPHINKFNLIIFQPRIDHLSSWSCSKRRLLDFAAKARGAAREIYEGKIKFNASKEACRFCRGKADCLTYKDWSSKTAADDFDDLTAVI